MRVLLVLVSVFAFGQASVEDPCKCTGDNSKIPKKRKQYSNTDYGTKCKSWDMQHRYCNNPKSLQEANRACWCPMSWCYVSKDCESAEESIFFKGHGLYYSYESCGFNADKCFGETEDKEGQYLEADAEDHSKDDQTTVSDVVDAVVILTIRVNEIAGTVNELSSAVATLQTEAGFEAVVPDDLVVTTFSEGDDEAGGAINFTTSWWGETFCPLGYKVIKSSSKCLEAAKQLKRLFKDEKAPDKLLEENMDGDKDKVCTFCREGAACSKEGAQMSKDHGREDVAMICRNSNSEDPGN